MSRIAESRFAPTQPRYALLAQALVDDISAGRYPVGTLLPTEFDLAAQFGLSRHTVREAMRRLRELGLVTRQQGVGTRVKAQARGATGGVDPVASISDLFQYLRGSRLKLHAEDDVAVTEANAGWLRSRPGQRWTRFTVSRVDAAGVPMAWSHIYVNPAYRGIAPKIDGARKAIYQLIEEQYGPRVVEVEQDISPAALGARMARALDLRAGALALRIVRHYLDAADRQIEASVSHYPASRFSYGIRMRFDGGAPNE